MRIEPVSSASASPGQVQTAPGGASFADALRQSINSLADVQAAADVASQNVATGDLAHLHEAVIAIQEASLALDLVVSVRNHVVEGLQELLRTQA